MRPDGRKPLVVADKNARGDASAEGLASVRVPRVRNAPHRPARRRPPPARRRAGDRPAQPQEPCRRADQPVARRRDGRRQLQGQAVGPGRPASSPATASGGSIECAVRWIRGDRFGLEFAHETRIDCDARDPRRAAAAGDPHAASPSRRSSPAPDPARLEQLDDNRAVARHPLIWNGVLHHDYRMGSRPAAQRLERRRADRMPGEPAERSRPSISSSTRSAALPRPSAGAAATSRASPSTSRSTSPTLAKAAPDLASEGRQPPDFDGEGYSDQSAWAPQWQRLSVDELGAKPRRLIRRAARARSARGEP